MAISVAGIFLVIFFADIVRQGYTAFQQTEIAVEVTHPGKSTTTRARPSTRRSPPWSAAA